MMRMRFLIRLLMKGCKSATAGFKTFRDSTVGLLGSVVSLQGSRMSLNGSIVRLQSFRIFIFMRIRNTALEMV
jgi:hypothetical protein